MKSSDRAVPESTAAASRPVMSSRLSMVSPVFRFSSGRARCGAVAAPHPAHEREYHYERGRIEQELDALGSRGIADERVQHLAHRAVLVQQARTVPQTVA